jgi:hypothetical protein
MPVKVARRTHSLSGEEFAALRMMRWTIQSKPSIWWDNPEKILTILYSPIVPLFLYFIDFSGLYYSSLGHHPSLKSLFWMVFSSGGTMVWRCASFAAPLAAAMAGISLRGNNHGYVMTHKVAVHA